MTVYPPLVNLLTIFSVPLGFALKRLDVVVDAGTAIIALASELLSGSETGSTMELH